MTVKTMRLLCALPAMGLLALAMAGCAHLGRRYEESRPASDVPSAAEILADLAQNDGAVRNLHASAVCVLRSPDLAAAEKFVGQVDFRRPADLRILGRNQLGVLLFRLICVGSEFLMEFPKSNRPPYYRFEGEDFASVPFNVSPADIVGEMFLPEDWAVLGTNEVRLVHYNAEGSVPQATVEIGPRKRPRRRLTVLGHPWVVAESTRLGPEGEELAVTTRKEYETIDGIRLPKWIRAVFPPENTEMVLDLRRIRPNVKMDDSLFEINWRPDEDQSY